MPKPKRLSGNELSIFSSFGFVIHSQRGLHVKLRRITEEGQKQTLTIRRHQELDSGTIRAIYRQASKYIQEDELGSLIFIKQS